ncbi:MAG: hypothetical protein AABZ60_21625 [Planctomycetota bacterium]
MGKKSFSSLLGNIQEGGSVRKKEGLSFEEMTPEEKKRIRRNRLIIFTLMSSLCLFWFSPWKDELFSWATKKIILNELVSNLYGVYEVQSKIENLQPKEREDLLEMITTTLLSNQDSNVRLRMIEAIELCYADSYIKLRPILEKALSQEKDYVNIPKLETFLKKITAEQYLQSISLIKTLWSKSASSLKNNYKKWKNVRIESTDNEKKGK